MTPNESEGVESFATYRETAQQKLSVTQEMATIFSDCPKINKTRLRNQDWKQLTCSNSDSRFCHGTSGCDFFAKFCAGFQLFSPKEYIEE